MSLKSAALVLALAALVLTSCVTGVPAKKISSQLSLGVSREKIETSFGARGRFQFVALVDGDEYECRIYSLGRTEDEYYFVFRQNALISINKPWKFEHREVIDNVSTEMPWDTEAKLNAVVKDVGLTVQQVLSELDASARGAKAGKPSFSVLPAFVILLPIVPILAAGAMTEHANDAQQHQRWRKQFDPEKTKLGMLQTDVERAYGAPKYTVSDGSRTTLAFVPKDSLYLYERRYWLAIEIENGKVTKILSEWFFNSMQLCRPENAVAGG